MEMVKTKLIVLLLCIGALSGYAQSYEWSSVKVDGSRTGCVPPDQKNLPATLGQFMENGDYYAPNGKKFEAKSSTAAVAAVVAAAQPKMQRVKTVIAYSEDEMAANKLYESALSNWFVDIVMTKVASLSGKQIDVPTRRVPPRGTPRVPAPLPLSPFSLPDRDRRGDSPAWSGRGSRPSRRTSG